MSMDIWNQIKFNINRSRGKIAGKKKQNELPRRLEGSSPCGVIMRSLDPFSVEDPSRCSGKSIRALGVGAREVADYL